MVCIPTATEIRCVGDNSNGMLGDGTFSSRDTIAPTIAASGGGPSQLALGQNHACAVLADSSVACWGDNTYGQVGNGRQNRSAGPHLVQFP